MKLGLNIVMKYYVARGYLAGPGQGVPMNNYAMQQIMYKGGLLGEGKGTSHIVCQSDRQEQSPEGREGRSAAKERKREKEESESTSLSHLAAAGDDISNC